MACAAAWLDGPYWLIGLGPAWLKAAARLFRCRSGRGHIVAAARLQPVNITNSLFNQPIFQHFAPG